MTTDAIPESDILIVGGGLNGPALALACANAGVTVTIVDTLPKAARTSDTFDGRGYALALSSQRLLKAVGIWDGVAQNAQPILDVKVTDGRPDEGPAPFLLEFRDGEIDESPMGYMVEDRYLRQACLAALDAHPKITQVEGYVAGQTVDEGGAELTLSDGRTLRGRLIAGCDGRTSGTARRAGIGRTGWGYGQTALVCAISHEKPHHGCAHQFFLPSGPLAILPLPGNRSSIVWTEKDKLAADIEALSEEDYLAVLRPRFGDFLGEISLAGQRFSYPLNITLANAFIAPRVALVGDAAHGMHPIAGQGLNAGLKDVAALAEVLVDARRRGEDIGREEVLARYQQWRRFDISTMALMTDGFNRLFSNDNPLLRVARDIGMGVVNSVAGLRRAAIREAAGVSGDLPKLLRGIPL
ncbi:FAD-dependent monooxygenase [Celeribacter indicus]|uniref:UbiH/UbiF/VisC/COQ6 family ubiquinone biosynthesis hydroxylase n=1 Tax=Celeribacter indicus TaxID=1208324 RepID=A0A0B5DVB1_9RHOB|nr:FAD-dependent monooxygenase [Celeribacter indicus]AJE45130.1 UbiH/UbiF/VisC/COQ6 family ubiquinone biosynthesis hydroxylase [Celeribacter indicus]SDX26772.1 2-octaprenyl-6-methoxyphenol hydroxylase [Celeribacter indicus]